MCTSAPLEIGSVVTIALRRDIEEEAARRRAVLKVRYCFHVTLERSFAVYLSARLETVHHNYCPAVLSYFFLQLQADVLECIQQLDREEPRRLADPLLLLPCKEEQQLEPEQQHRRQQHQQQTHP